MVNKINQIQCFFLLHAFQQKYEYDMHIYENSLKDYYL